jgi:hypothetical protein
MKKLPIFCMSALFILAQDPTAESIQAIPKPPEIGQFFCLLDGKLISHLEETTSITTYGDLIKIKGAKSKVMLDHAPNLSFVVHLPDKSISSYSLRTPKEVKNRRTMIGGRKNKNVTFSAVEYADGYFELTPKVTLAPGQYAFLVGQYAHDIAYFHSFEVN